MSHELKKARVLLIGAGGLGSACAPALADAGLGRLTIIDDDRVDETNLHRQLLYTEADVGKSKVACALERLGGEGTQVVGISNRFLPENAVDLAREHDLVIEGADNLATKFLALDACAIARVPLVQAGCVRWSGWAFVSDWRANSACMRCVFEDLPRDRIETCAEAGVVGPVVGVLGALQAYLALALLRGEPAGGLLWNYRALEGVFRASPVKMRAGCEACAGLRGPLGIERYQASCSML